MWPFKRILPIMICFTVVTLWAQEPGVQAEYKTVPPKPNERCFICGVRLTSGDVVLIVRGRRVPLKKTMVDSFMHNQGKYFARLQPRSALFQENQDVPQGVSQGGISPGWFLFGLYVLSALLFAGLSGFIAVNKCLNPISCFFVGLTFHLFGFLYVLTRLSPQEKAGVPPGLRKMPTTYAPVPCPKCGHLNHPSAKKCAVCGAELRPAVDSEVDRTQLR